MGIQGLLPLLKSCTDAAHVSDFKGLDVGVDSLCWLHKAVYGCATALATGQPTTAHLRYCEERVDLLLSDIALGAGMRGSELARQVRAKLPQVAVLLMSGYSAELLQAPDASAASWELLRKPFERDELARAVVRALASHPSATRQDLSPPRRKRQCRVAAAKLRSM